MALGGGSTIIDGKPYFLLHAAPQFDLGPWGFGFDGNIRIDEQGHIRKEDYKDAYSLLRWINYISFYKPQDDFYLRIGGLEHASIGHGTLVSDYWNGSSYDDRKIGAAARVDLGLFGAEGLTSDIAAWRGGLTAVRPFVRPFQLLPLLTDIWILHNLEIGVTGVVDFDTNATKIIPNHEPWVTHFKSATDSTFDSVVVNRDSAQIPAPLTALGLDITSLLWQTEKTQGRIYADYVRFQHFNQGFIVGARTSFYPAENILLDLRAERSFYRDQFLPSYFNGFYERDRFDDQAKPQDYITKLTLLSDTTSGNGNGFRAGAFLNVQDEFEFQGNYLHLDNLTGKDWMELEVALPKITDRIFAKAIYTRKDINGVSDLFALDERSLMFAEASYKPFNWILVTLLSRWTFAIDDNGHLHTQSMIEPKVDVILSL